MNICIGDIEFLEDILVRGINAINSLSESGLNMYEDEEDYGELMFKCGGIISRLRVYEHCLRGSFINISDLKNEN